MTELLEHFTPTHIIMFIVLLCVAAKEVIDFIDWVKGKIANRDKNVQEEHTEKEELVETIEELQMRCQAVENKYKGVTEVLNNISNKVDLLIQSDKDAIKAYITNQHHILCYERGWVDDYTMDCLEKRFGHYIEEQGNSFIEQLMNEIRELPRQPYSKP